MIPDIRLLVAAFAQALMRESEEALNRATESEQLETCTAERAASIVFHGIARAVAATIDEMAKSDQPPSLTNC